MKNTRSRGKDVRKKERKQCEKTKVAEIMEWKEYKGNERENETKTNE
jgi:hypothetical protein